MEHETGILSDKPVIMTEYAHAMGNGPGALFEYWEKIYKYKTFAGGFVWEFKNHGFLKDGKFLYGGDFAEVNHAYNFNLDGFVFSNGTPKPAMKELAYVFSPVWCEYEHGIKLTNTNDFADIDAIKWELVEDYNVIEAGIKEIALPPKGCTTLNIRPKTIKPGAVYRVNIIYEDTVKQIELPYSLPKEKFIKSKFNYTLFENRIVGDNFEIEFKNGMLSKYTIDNKIYIDHPMKFNFYRKPTDNDGIKGKRETLTNEWDKALLRYFNFYVENRSVCEKENEVIFKFQGKILPEGKFAGFFAETEYRVYKDGRILVAIKAEPYGNMPGVLPVIGVVFEMPYFDEIEWYGRGEHENYSDRAQGAVYGLYKKNVSDMSVRYERPQENGNRCDTYFVNAGGLSFTGCEKFEFSVHDYTFDELMEANHIGEIKKSDKNFLYINYKTRGLGSASCGPGPEDKYELKPHSFVFAFLIGKKEEFKNLEYDVKTQKLSNEYYPKDIAQIKENFDCR